MKTGLKTHNEWCCNLNVVYRRSLCVDFNPFQSQVTTRLSTPTIFRILLVEIVFVSVWTDDFAFVDVRKIVIADDHFNRLVDDESTEFEAKTFNKIYFWMKFYFRCAMKLWITKSNEKRQKQILGNATRRDCIRCILLDRFVRPTAQRTRQ